MSPEPTVGVNLLWLVPGVVGGSEDAVCGLLRGLADLGEGAGVRTRLFVLDGFAAAHPDLADAFETDTLVLTGRAKGARVLAEQTWLPRRSRGLSLMHHAGGTVPVWTTAPPSLMVHDLQPLDLPDNFHPVKRRYLGAMLPRSVRAARVVTVPSRFVADGVARLGVPAERIHVIPNPVPRPRGVPGPPADGGRPALLDRLGIPGPYVLYPAITYPHKNHAVLLDAFARLRPSHPEARLVLTGGAAGCEDEVSARIARPDLVGAVVRPGRLPRGELETLLTHASVLACPSRYEGFGIPVVEAALAGVPVVASTAAALPEVAPPSARLVDPDDVGAWSEALGAALDEMADPAGLSAGERAADAVLLADRCDPAHGARLLLDAWRAALEGPSGGGATGALER